MYDTQTDSYASTRLNQNTKVNITKWLIDFCLTKQLPESLFIVQ